jgi:O-antigen ligase
VLLPIGVYLARRERRVPLRVVAAASTLLVLAGFMLSFSRGGFIALVGLIVVATLLGFVRPRHLAAVLVGGTLLLLLVAPSYTARMVSIANVGVLFTDASSEPDGAILGRTTSNLAALQVFLAHPAFGVGPGQYFQQYSREVANTLSLRRFDTQRRAHNLYLETAADLGLSGLLALLAVVGAALVPLWRLRQRFRLVDPPRADLATAMGLALVAYMFSAVFLHLAYERYFWVLMALLASTAWILARDLADGEPHGLMPAAK